MAHEIGDKNRASWALGDMGISARDQGNSEQAISYFSEALTFARESGESRAIGVSLYNLAESHEVAGNLDTSRSLWEQGLSIFREERDKTHIAWGLEGLAQVAAAKGEAERAATLWGAAEQLRTAMNTPLDPSRRAVYASLIPSVRAQLGEGPFDAAWAQGRAMTLEQAIMFASGEN